VTAERAEQILRRSDAPRGVGSLRASGQPPFRNDQRRNRRTRRKNEWLRALRAFGVVRRALLSTSRKELLDNDQFPDTPHRFL